MMPRSVWMTMALVAGLSAGCGAMRGGAQASAELRPTAGQSVQGQLWLQTQGDAVAVRVVVTGLKPGQLHGFHVHEKGDCSAPDGTSAGGHFNPHAKPHGPQHADHHAGDMPALQADANGRAEVRFVLSGVTLGQGAADLVGRGVIVHANADDYATQPTGNSGPRVACGVIRAM